MCLFSNRRVDLVQRSAEQREVGCFNANDLLRRTIAAFAEASFFTQGRIFEPLLAQRRLAARRILS
jgi:hypothetical protein